MNNNADDIKKWSQVPREYLENYGEEGDLSKEHLLNPAIFKLLGEISNKRILEVGCGNGYLCRMMAKKGAEVTGLEPAQSMYEYAVERENEEKLDITYLQEDLSQMTQFEDEFDVVIANMVLLDIPDFESAMKNSIAALKHAGLFIFSLSHPCFFPSVDWKKDQAVCIPEYFEEYSVEGTYGTSYHRTLSTYINLVIQLDCTVEEIIEPQLEAELINQFPQLERDFHVPSFIVIKCKKINER